jgi:hypothetical protein
MAVDTQDRKVSYTMTAGVYDYAFTFRALTSASGDIKCKRTVIATGVETDLVYYDDYIVIINSDGIGGVVTVLDTSCTSALKLTIYRETTDLQSSDYNDYNQFPAETLEGDLDKRTLKSQEMAEDVARSVKVAITSTLSTVSLAEPVANKIIGWNAGGTALENKDTINASYLTQCTNAATTASTAALAAQAAQAAAEAVAGWEVASQAEAEAGTNNTKVSTPLRVQQAIDALVGATTPIAIARGGTGTNSTTYCDLTANVRGTLPVGKGGTGVTAAANSANGVVVLNSSGQIPAIDASLLTNIPVPSATNIITGVLALANGGTGQATANLLMGASVVTYTGNNAGKTVAHALGRTPKIVVVCVTGQGSEPAVLWMYGFPATGSITFGGSYRTDMIIGVDGTNVTMGTYYLVSHDAYSYTMWCM